MRNMWQASDLLGGPGFFFQLRLNHGRTNILLSFQTDGWACCILPSMAWWNSQRFAHSSVAFEFMALGTELFSVVKELKKRESELLPPR
jgi:hypothetical protein